MITITRKLEFDAGHRVLGHEGKCKHLHGHRYVAEVTVTAPELDDLGRVIDFSKIKSEVGGWIDDNWDHNVLLHMDDGLLLISVPTHAGTLDLRSINGRAPYTMAGNPTAENMVKTLFRVAVDLLGPYGMTVVHVRLYETPNCWADCDNQPL